MIRSSRLRLHEIRRVHELIQRISEVGDQPDVWRQVALSGLNRLLGGNVGLTADIQISDQGMPSAANTIDTGWQTESARSRFGEYVMSGEMATDPGTTRLLTAHRTTRFITVTRRELVEDREWYGSPCVSEARRLGDVNDFVVSSILLSPGQTQGLVIYRAWNDRPFDLKQKRLLRLFHLELLRVARDSSGPRLISGELPRLAPRLKQTLELMLTSLSLKEIADQLKLSRHTINDYQKALYKTFGVRSRAELMCQFRPSKPGIRLAPSTHVGSV